MNTVTIIIINNMAVFIDSAIGITKININSMIINMILMIVIIIILLLLLLLLLIMLLLLLLLLLF